MQNIHLVCEVCGNEIDSHMLQCPFCSTKRNPEQSKREGAGYRTVNLEKGMPLVKDALSRLQNEIRTAGLNKERVLVLIHGYGSSGQGGAIKKEVRRQLQFLYDKKSIQDYVPGEKCDKRSGRFRQLARRFPFVEKFVRKPNPGITFVIL